MLVHHSFSPQQTNINLCQVFPADDLPLRVLPSPGPHTHASAAPSESQRHTGPSVATLRLPAPGPTSHEEYLAPETPTLEQPTLNYVWTLGGRLTQRVCYMRPEDRFQRAWTTGLNARRCLSNGGDFKGKVDSDARVPQETEVWSWVGPDRDGFRDGFLNKPAPPPGSYVPLQWASRAEAVAYLFGAGATKIVDKHRHRDRVRSLP